MVPCQDVSVYVTVRFAEDYVTKVNSPKWNVVVYLKITHLTFTGYDRHWPNCPEPTLLNMWTLCEETLIDSVSDNNSGLKGSQNCSHHPV